ncbi:MAG TPA: TrbI/VirB10 family protein [Gammaproteobacteria bacterium]|jgi:conjugal transfer pilus assembly protein TraB|nr:TrbI/VirB10 family protein [Gammaproteobacteria bacterium]
MKLAIYIEWLAMVENTNSSKIKKSQTNTMALLLVVLCFVFGGVYYFISEAPKVDIEDKKSHFTNPLDQVDVSSTILENTQKQLREAEKKAHHLQNQINTLATTQANDQDKKANVDELKKRLDELEKSLITTPQNISVDKPVAHEINPYAQGLLVSPSQQTNNIGHSEIREDNLTLAAIDLESRTPLKTPDTYVPAGTFVKAVVIGGADASAAVNAQANPKVMLLRIIEEGTLPNQRKSHLKDCMVTGSVTGDVSSERGSIRTERISCVFMNDEVVEQQVEGIVFGPDGKVDVRGNLHEGGGQYVGRAFAAGALSGLSEGLSETYTANSISPEGTVQTVNTGKFFQYGAAKGTSKAMDKMADYQIKKAEQFHPIIQLSAGTVVDIVFQKGFFLDGKQHEDSDKTTVGNYATSATPSLFPMPNTGKTLPLTEEQVKRLQEKNKQLGFRIKTMGEQ